jgi:hypothetical protein
MLTVKDRDVLCFGAVTRKQCDQGGLLMLISQVESDRSVRHARGLLQRILPQWAADSLVLRKATGGIPRWESMPSPASVDAFPALSLKAHRRRDGERRAA